MKYCILRCWLALGSALLCLSQSDYSAAQIVPDATLPINSTVTPQGTTSKIDGGTRAGNNLLHSFREFSVPTGSEAFFNNAFDIQNIFTRVTGSSISNIDGLIRANGTANLFLLNPNGIIFGPNAQLNIGGSFLATTASQINFSNGTQFSATNPNSPPLLTISVPIGLQWGTTPPSGSIVLQGSTLQLPPGQTLALVGGNVSLDAARLVVPGGRIELGGLADAGTIGLENQPSLAGTSIAPLSFPGNVTRADVSLINEAEVNVRAGGGGSIVINTRNLDVLGTSRLRAGIESEMGSPESRAGNIDINATATITVANNSSIANTVLTDGVGNAGDINITTESLFVTNGALLNTTTFGKGDGGRISITARNTVSFDASEARSNVGIESKFVLDPDVIDPDFFSVIGNSGGINITTGSLSLTNGSLLNATTYAKGNPGNVNINARETITLANGSFIQNAVDTGALGNAGDINVTTGSLFVTNGSRLVASTDGRGNAGKVTVNARDTVSLDGENRTIFSAIFSAVGDSPLTTGNGGSIEINTGSLFLTNGARLIASTFGEGDTGNVTINARDTVSMDGSSQNFFRDPVENLSGISIVVREGARGNGGKVEINTGSLSVTNGARLSASTLGQGDAGNITINARDTVSFDGVSGGLPSSALTTVGEVERTQKVKGGNLEINTGSLSVTNGAQLQSDTFAFGDAGNITINARETVTFDGVVGEGILRRNSGAFSRVGDGGRGNGGKIEINTGSLFVTNGARISSSTRDFGNAGQIIIRARDRVVFDGITPQGESSLALSAVEHPDAVGNGGLIEINTGSLSITNGAALSTSSSSARGAAGNINLIADSIRMDNAEVRSNTRGGEGNINVRSRSISQAESRSLILTNNSRITSNATGTAIGGNIILNTGVLAALQNSDISANAEDARGGRVGIQAQAIFGATPRTREQLQTFLSPDTPLDPSRLPTSDITAISQQGGAELQGTVTINTPEVDPSSGLIGLPENFVDVTGLVVDRCSPARQGSSFTITGRGGLPPSPDEPLSPQAFLVDLIALDSQPQVSRGETHNLSAKTSAAIPNAEIVEATGWVINEKGQVVLTASGPNVQPTSPWLTPPTCPASIR